jgi:MerR family mercuric resistance operon transcriptional regulator
LSSRSDIKIGELSRRTHCNIETIRYYERIGLLPQARRTVGRLRSYESEDVARLRFIRRARQLGFTLDDVRALMRIAATGNGNARTQARSLARAHLAEIQTKIADLQAMERVLSDAICECESRRKPGCPLIKVLSGGDDETAT